ncbi:MAG: hypothetical protein MHPSP_003899, partial [Paramarteilia canceri]
IGILDLKTGELVCDLHMQTRNPDIFGAGDCTKIDCAKTFYKNFANAVTQGEVAGINMAKSTKDGEGLNVIEPQLSYSDLGPEMSYDYLINNKSKEDRKIFTFISENDPNERGPKYNCRAVSFFYCPNSKTIEGIFLFNTLGKENEAKFVINSFH